MMKNKSEKYTDNSVKAKIIEAFLFLSSKNGGGFVTLQQIAKKAKVAFGTVRYHFAGEDNLDLYSSALEYILKHSYEHHEKFIGSARESESVNSSNFNPIEVYIKSMFCWVNENSTYASYLVYYYHLCTTSSKWGKDRDIYLQKARTRIQTLLLEAAGRGVYKIKIDELENLCIKIHDHIVGACIVAAIQLNSTKLNEELCIHAVNQIIRS